tara:strand:- start:362 stop:1417 length:1056 start_codon:yes stop_codon:yes gene_type:complete
MFWASDNKDFQDWGSFYDFIFSHFLLLHGFQNEHECRRYLNDLKPFCSELWRSYQDQAGKLKVDYTSPLTQEAYLLRYGPLYSKGVQIILDRLGAQGKSPLGVGMEISIFSAGPATEIIPIIKSLKKLTIFSHLDPREITINLVDKISWEFPRSVVLSSMKEYQEENQSFVPKINEVANDIFNDQLVMTPGKSDLIIFQNCLNEYMSQKNEDETLTSISRTIDYLSETGLLIFSERSGYRMKTFLERFSAYNDNSLIELDFDHVEDEAVLSKEIPEILKEELLTGEHGLIPSRYNKMDFVIFRKRDLEMEEFERNQSSSWETEAEEMSRAPDPRWSEDERIRDEQLEDEED